MLTDSKIKRLKPPLNAKKPDKYSDGNGLQLHIFTSYSTNIRFVRLHKGK